jgi:hypothetical protein
MCGSYEVVNWILKNSEQEFELIDLIHCNNLELLKQYYIHPRQITTLMVKQSIISKNIEMLDWLLSKNSLINEYLMNLAVIDNTSSYHMVRYLYEKNVPMTSEAFYRLINNNDITTIKWLLDRGFIITECYIDSAIERNLLCLLKLMLRYFPEYKKNIEDLLMGRQANIFQ